MLPLGVQKLQLQDNRIKDVPALPNTLIVLNIDFNSIKALPEICF